MNANVTKLFLELMLVAENHSSSDIMALRHSLLTKDLDATVSHLLDTVLLLKQQASKGHQSPKSSLTERSRVRENLSIVRSSLNRMTEDKLNLLAFRLGIRKTASKDVILKEIERKITRAPASRRDEIISQIRSQDRPDEGFMNLVDFLVNGSEEHSEP